jgi:aryl-alcohol dehydrogenase-like predicted oxidoreductase
MRRRALGKTGLQVSEVGFGAWAIGGIMWGGRRDIDARSALDQAIERGVNLFDTALVYGDGHSERLVGEAVRKGQSPAGGDLLVASKVPPKTMRWPAGRGASLDEVFPPGWIRRCCELSLRHLGLERIDIYQLHVWEPHWLRERRWFDELSALKAERKIGSIGVSINTHEPEAAVELARSGQADVLQVVYNIFEQAPSDELFPVCLEHGVGVLARVPLDEGSLTGKLTPQTTFPPDDFRNWYFGGPRLLETIKRVDAVRPFLMERGGGMVRGALRFCLSHPAVSTVIPGMRNAEQVDEDCRAAEDAPYTAAELEELGKHRWKRVGGH